MMRFIGKHSLLGPTASSTLLSANLLDSSAHSSHFAGSQFLDSVQQKPPGDESVEALLAGRLAFDVKTRGTVKEHDAGGSLVHVLAAMAARPDESLFEVRLAHFQAGHSFGQLIFFFTADGKCAHRTTLPGSTGNRKDSTAWSAHTYGCAQKTLPFILGRLTLAVPVCLTILGSGSSGNCAYLETSQARVLIDAGLSLRQIRKRLATIGRVPENLTAILITHEHSDHVQGLAQLVEKLRIPVYCNRPTREAIEYQQGNRLECRQFETGATFDLEDLSVETFSIPHDAQDPVGFLLKTSYGNVGFLTDLGHATRLAIERIRRANVLILESNHDVKLLQDCPHRPWSLKQRILSRHGHLSNEAAAEVAEQIMSGDLRHIYLSHISRECNRPQLAFQVMSQRLQKLGASHVHLELTSQVVPCPTLTLEAHQATGPAPAPPPMLRELFGQATFNLQIPS
jgi:phosphoribosyl 1,2-cyclic phosphodiesterase